MLFPCLSLQKKKLQLCFGDIMTLNKCLFIPFKLLVHLLQIHCLQGTGIPLQLYKVHAKLVWFSFRKQYSLTPWNTLSLSIYFHNLSLSKCTTTSS